MTASADCTARVYNVGKPGAAEGDETGWLVGWLVDVCLFNS